MSRPQLSEPVPVRLPVDVLDDIEAVAKLCDRTRSWVMVRALRLYLRTEGARILAVQKAREEVASGEARDMEDVIRELEALNLDGAER